MARIHNGLKGGMLILVGGALVGSLAVSKGTSFAWGMFWGEDEPIVAASPPGFDVEFAPEPKKEPEEPAPEEKPATLTERVEARREKPAPRERVPAKKESLTDKWLAKVNGGGMYAFGEANGVTEGAYNPDGECEILQPLRVRAMIADSGTTDVQSMAIGAIAEDVQGQNSYGEWCVAIPAGSVVSFNVQEAGEYATNRAPVQVGSIWMEDGFEVKVDQPAKHIDGIPGVIGKVNHHTFKKSLAGAASVLFGLANNVTSALSFRANEVTNPVEDSLRKTLERPSEITFSGKAVEFDLMPVATPGYNQ